MFTFYFTVGGFVAGFVVCWIYKAWIYNKLKADYETLRAKLP